MPIVILKLPELKISPNRRPPCCPYCGGQVLQRWGGAVKSVSDTHDESSVIYRYRCGACQGTFRHYPEGLDRSPQTPRLRQLAGLAWALGMSTREVVAVFEQVGIPISHMTVWRAGQSLLAQRGNAGNTRKDGRYSIDRVYVHKISSKLGVVVALDLGQGKSIVLGTLAEGDPWKVKSWLESVVGNTDIEVTVMETGVLRDFRARDPNENRSRVRSGG